MLTSRLDRLRVSLILAPLCVLACGDDKEDNTTVAATATDSATDSASTSSTGTTTNDTQDASTSSTTTTTSTSATDSATATGTGEETTGGPVVPGCQSMADQVKPGGPSLNRVIGRPDLANTGNNPGAWQADPPDPAGGGVSFIMTPDGGGVSIECSVWEQDCPEGEKCMPWANDGGNAWNATRCSPIDVNPDGVGETCSVEGSGVSGVDSCDASSMCWGVDTETNMGTCISFCEGSEANPTCSEPNTMCSISNEGVLILCLPICNPLANECPETLGCYSTGDVFLCAPDASGDMGGAGDPCEFINACDNGLACVNAALVPDCAGAAGCCSSTCEVGDDSPCLPGQTCVPWYEDGQEPLACLEGVGVCTLPS